MEDGHRRRRTAAVCIPTHNATRRRTPTRWSSRGAGPCRARRHLKPLLFHELGAQEKKPAGNVFIEPERSCYARSDIELDASTCCDAVYRETGLRPLPRRSAQLRLHRRPSVRRSSRRTLTSTTTSIVLQVTIQTLPCFKS
ncbi:hypothetical protein U9M48_003181 [Paspalum notatum var. saurae]|uniref:Uncharacterized protein n=1 Tax=Paspalum notatum var. saurae TaxID=547442 RepID=A0AAQ3PME5_PASNO